MTERPEAFDCVICQRYIDNCWSFIGPSYALKPVCLYCEGTWGVREPANGAFRDRRIVRQIGVLANAIESEAYQQNWSYYAS